MPQVHTAKRRDKSKLAPYEYMLSIIDVGKAAHVIHRTISGDEDVTARQLSTSIVVFNKMVPSFQAIAIQHSRDEAESIEDMNALLMSSGIDPGKLWSTLAAPSIDGEIVSKGDDSAQNPDGSKRIDDPACTRAREEPQTVDIAEENADPTHANAGGRTPGHAR